MASEQAATAKEAGEVPILSEEQRDVLRQGFLREYLESQGTEPKRVREQASDSDTESLDSVESRKSREKVRSKKQKASKKSHKKKELSESSSDEASSSRDMTRVKKPKLSKKSHKKKELSDSSSDEDSSSSDSDSSLEEEEDNLSKQAIKILKSVTNPIKADKVIKKFLGEKSSQLESPLLTAFEREDDMDCSHVPANGPAIFSLSLDNRLRDANQNALDELKPFLKLMSSKKKKRVSQKKLRKALRAGAAFAFRSSYIQNQTRLSLLLRQFYPRLSKAGKAENLANRLSKGAIFKRKAISTLTNEGFAEQLEKIRKVDQATKDFDLATQPPSGPFPQRSGFPSTSSTQSGSGKFIPTNNFQNKN
jgi:hypothetical protein